MKSNKIALAAILLWVITVAVFAWFFIRGNTVAGSDSRTAVVLGASERELVLREMRGMLSAVHGVLEGINRGDLKQVAQSSRAAGMGTAADINPALMAKLPLPFKQLGMSVHHEMDDLASAAESGKPVAELQQMLTGSLAKCVACHAAWQIKAGG
ncbi:MAG: hypothetical protein HY846_12645 [Nitrosomonadales bacterium]|nr:hypothetical protein [Nitrosomonadales bacterium]